MMRSSGRDPEVAEDFGRSVMLVHGDEDLDAAVQDGGNEMSVSDASLRPFVRALMALTLEILDAEEAAAHK
jgi:hypothetical protein